MPRKLKVYRTSQGFFDLAIAAPSMKAALEAWGANSNLFHQGFAEEVTDISTVEAAMAKPGVVLKRPVGTNRAFSENARLPSDLEIDDRRSRSKVSARKKSVPAGKRAHAKATTGKQGARPAPEKAERKREAERRKREAAELKYRQRREKELEKARAAYDRAEREHKARAGALEHERTGLEKREKAEELRWKDLRDRLQDAISKAGG